MSRKSSETLQTQTACRRTSPCWRDLLSSGLECLDRSRFSLRLSSGDVLLFNLFLRRSLLSEPWTHCLCAGCCFAGDCCCSLCEADNVLKPGAPLFLWQLCKSAKYQTQAPNLPNTAELTRTALVTCSKSPDCRGSVSVCVCVRVRVSVCAGGPCLGVCNACRGAAVLACTYCSIAKV